MSNTRVPKILLIITAILAVPVIALLAFMAGRGTAPVKQAVNTNVNAKVTTNTTTQKTNGNKNTTTAVTKNINETVTNTNTVETVETVAAVTDEGVTWLAEPELIDDVNLFSDSASSGVDDTYYKVADLADGGEIIYVNRVTLGTEVDRFRKTADGTYYLLANHSAEYYRENTEALATAVEVDDTTTYAALDYPDEITVAGITLEQHWLPFTSNELFSQENDDPAYPFVEIEETPYGTIYLDVTAVTTTEDDGSIESKSYVLRLADGSVVRYWSAKEFMADDGSLIAEFDAEADLADHTYFVGMIASGCGVLGGDQYVVDMTAEALDAVGTTTAGETLYAIRDSANPVLLNAYETYKLGRDYDGATEELLSYDEFVAATPILLWQDALGDYLLFMDNEFAPLVECGKPLIYLYPTEPTAVSVQVGADVTKSEPTYGDGWNVVAEPTGTQLYWEGKGYGEYPAITFGRVVPTKQVSLAMKSDLIKQGFTAPEIKDFLEFWLPHMPTTPYVRLSWLNTAQMNALAPLQITPRPDTVIRSFLDFAGQEIPDTTLQPQVLTATPRRGFTVMEWGGLLLGQ